MKKVIRHGDLCLVKIDQLPEDLTPSITKTLMQGVNKNNHDVEGGTIYLKDVDQFVFGYLVAGDNCILIHPDHGAGKGPLKTAQLPAGTYELRRQFEETHEAFKPVID
jgi:hypothetical protein